MQAINNKKKHNENSSLIRGVLIGAFATFSIASGFMESRAQESADHHDADQHEDQDHEDQDHDEHGHDEGLIVLAPGELQEFGIQVTRAGSGAIERYTSLPGEVNPNADRLAHIVPRYSGIVTEVRGQIGDFVQEGQVLAIIESDESLVSYELKTLIAGTVIQKHMTLGEAVSRERETYVVADLSTVWVDITVYLRDLACVAVGQSVLLFTGHGLPDASGTISYITPIVDEQTRTATARLVLPNPRGDWRPGMFVTAKVVLDRTDVEVAVPRTALHTVNGQTVVFVQDGGGFRARRVQLGKLGENSIEIVSGLHAGERYASKGGFTLKAELGKDSFSEGHSH